MPWILLILAGLLEAFWAVGLKFTNGFTKAVPSVLVAAAIGGSMFLLAMAMRDIPVGTAYAVWVSIGICATAIGQHFFFGHTLRWPQLVFLGLLMVSIIGLKLTSGAPRG